MFGGLENIIWINIDILTLRCDLDLECNNPIFPQDALAYDNLSSDYVWLPKNQQFRRYSSQSDSLIIWALAVTLALKTANNFCFAWHSGSICSITIPSLVTKCFVAQKISPGQLRSGELRTQKLKSHLVRTHSLNVLPLKPGVGQYITIYATLTARDFLLAYFYTSGFTASTRNRTRHAFTASTRNRTRHGFTASTRNRTRHGFTASAALIVCCRKNGRKFARQRPSSYFAATKMQIPPPPFFFLNGLLWKWLTRKRMSFLLLHYSQCIIDSVLSDHDLVAGECRQMSWILDSLQYTGDKIVNDFVSLFSTPRLGCLCILKACYTS